MTDRRFYAAIGVDLAGHKDVLRLWAGTGGVGVQTCVIHLMRNTFEWASKKYWAHNAADLNPIYRAPTRAAWAAFEEFEEEWESRIPRSGSCGATRRAAPAVLNYHPEIRAVLCSTNGIESLNARYRRAIATRGPFPTELAALKCLYLVTRSLHPKGTGHTR